MGRVLAILLILFAPFSSGAESKSYALFEGTPTPGRMCITSQAGFLEETDAIQVANGQVELGPSAIRSYMDDVEVSSPFGSTSRKRQAQFYGVQRSTLANNQTSAGFEFVFISESGGKNTDAEGKNKLTGAFFQHLKSTAGESHGFWFESTNAGTGDSIAMEIRGHCLGTLNSGGDEGCIGIRGDVQDYATIPRGTVTWTGGSVETVTPSGLSVLEKKFIGHGALAVCDEVGSTTNITVTDFDQGTRTLTYSEADQDFKGQCVAILGAAYKDAQNTDSYVPAYIDSDGTNTFTAQIRGAEAGVVAFPEGHLDGGAQSTPARIFPCTRIVDMNRDPNGDKDDSDTTLDLAGADWTGIDDFETRPTEGSCNGSFFVAPAPQEKMWTDKLLVGSRQGTTTDNIHGAIRICEQSDANGNSRQCNGAFVAQASGVGTVLPWKTHSLCETGDCRRMALVETSEDFVNQGPGSEHYSQVRINQSSPDANTGYYRYVDVLDGNSDAGMSLNINLSGPEADHKWSIGGKDVDRPIVTAPFSGGSQGQVLTYGGGNRMDDWSFETFSPLTVAGTPVTDPGTACETGDQRLDTATPELCYCIDGATDNWACTALTD